MSEADDEDKLRVKNKLSAPVHLEYLLDKKDGENLHVFNLRFTPSTENVRKKFVIQPGRALLIVFPEPGPYRISATALGRSAILRRYKTSTGLQIIDVETRGQGGN